MILVVLTTLSVLFGIMGISILRHFDIHEKEPFSKMLLVAVWGAVIAIGEAVLMNLSFMPAFMHEQNGVNAILITGPIEELAKLLALASIYFLIKDEMNEPLDGIIYISCAALGFSLIENFTYAFPNTQRLAIIVRLLISTPAHLLFSSFMGLAFYQVKKRNANLSPLIKAWLVSSVIHGIYDWIVREELRMIILILLFIFLRQVIVELICYSRAKSPFRTSLVAFINNNAPEQANLSIPCLHCGQTEMHKQWNLERIKIQECDTCGWYVCSLDALMHIFSFFGSTFLLQRVSIKKNAQNQPMLLAGNIIDPQRKIAAFELWDLHCVTEDLNQRQINNFEQRNIFRFILPKKTKPLNIS